jgi:ubiquitin-conjugating enzyme E2 A
MNSVRRLQKELAKLLDDPPEGVSAAPYDDSIFEWQGVICGPVGSPYEDGIFEVSISFTNQYPFVPPKVEFVSKVFHPNVSEEGRICLDILGNKWSPSYDIRSILISIQSLLVEPGLHSAPGMAANAEAESLFVSDRPSYIARIRQLVRMQKDPHDDGTETPILLSDD